MALSDYIEALKETKTYQCGLISFQEYMIEKKFFGLQRRLPPVPHADKDRHVIVLEVLGDQPTLYSVLADSRHSLDLTARNADSLLFVFVKMRPLSLAVLSPQSGYRLGDGNHIDAELQLTYQVTDAEIFWSGSQDPIATLDAVVQDAAKDFFLTKSSNDLIVAPGDLKHSLERHVQDVEPGIVVVKNGLERSIKGVHGIPGLGINQVSADIKLSKSLQEHLGRLHQRVFEPGGIADRRKIDYLIDKDATYAPYPLRDVIKMIDIGLLEDFYTRPWPAAMRLLANKIAEQKEEYFQTIVDRESRRHEILLKKAHDWGLDQTDLDELKGKAAQKLLDLADREDDGRPITDVQFIAEIANTSPIAGKLTADRSAESDK